MLGTVQRAEDTSVNNTHKNPCPVELIFYMGQKDSKRKKSKIGQWIKDKLKKRNLQRDNQVEFIEHGTRSWEYKGEYH